MRGPAVQGPARPAWPDPLAWVWLAAVLGVQAWGAPPWLMLPAFGASAVLLASLPDAPVCRPRAVALGMGVSALSAWAVQASAHVLGVPAWMEAALSVALVLGLMLRVQALHPPGGAMALWWVLQPPAEPVQAWWHMLPGVLMLTVWSLWNQRRRQPTLPAGHRTADALPGERLSPTAAQWQAVMAEEGLKLDLAPEQLQRLYRRLRWLGAEPAGTALRVGDFMSRDLVTLPPDAPVREAWRTLQRHRIRLLPIVQDGHLLGVVSLVDVLRRLGLDQQDVSSEALRDASHLMTSPVSSLMCQPRTVQEDTSVERLVPQLSDWGLHQVPVLDGQQRLVGMVSQSDLIAALHDGLMHRGGPPGPAGPASSGR